jgi:hypothetical protein
MSRPPLPDAPGPDEDAHDPVWALLARARDVPPSPHFSRRVLAAVRTGQAARDARWQWLRDLWSPALRPVRATAVLALLFAGAWHLRSSQSGRTSLAAHPAPAAAPAAASADDDGSEEMVETLASELALLEEVDTLLDPEDGLDLEEDDVGRLLF